MVAPQQPASASQQFSVRSLLIAMTLAGVAIMLISTLRIYGGAILMLVAAAATQFLLRDRPAVSPLQTRTTRRLRLWVDLLWGIAIPLMCLLLDPFVLRDNLLTLETSFFKMWSASTDTYWMFAGDLKIYAIPIYTLIAAQMTLLLTCFFGPETGGKVAALRGGALFAGGVFASLAAVALAMPSTAGLFVFGAGVIGFSPIGAAFVYFPHGLDGYKVSRLTLPRYQTEAYFAGGFVCGIAIPVAAGCLLEWIRQSVIG